MGVPLPSPRILLTGVTGQVGWELHRALAPLGELVAVDRAGLDLADLAALRDRVREIKPAVIVNAAAYTAVDRAEEEESLAVRINGEAPGVLAEEARRLGAMLVHYSTDYVFDGSKQGRYSELDPTGPLGVYGRSKLVGEQAVAQAGADHLLLRTCWVYADRGGNFLLTMLRLLREREQLGIVADQRGTPTWARLIAETTALVLHRSLLERAESAFSSGLYHLAAAGETSWHGFATAIQELHNQQRPGDALACRIDAIATEQYPTPARRPANSRLAVDALERRFGLRMPEWREQLARCLEGR